MLEKVVAPLLQNHARVTPTQSQHPGDQHRAESFATHHTRSRSRTTYEPSPAYPRSTRSTRHTHIPQSPHRPVPSDPNKTGKTSRPYSRSRSRSTRGHSEKARFRTSRRRSSPDRHHRASEPTPSQHSPSPSSTRRRNTPVVLIPARRPTEIHLVLHPDHPRHPQKRPGLRHTMQGQTSSPKNVDA